jgi:hypothetical protein
VGDVAVLCHSLASLTPRAFSLLSSFRSALQGG